MIKHISLLQYNNLRQFKLFRSFIDVALSRSGVNLPASLRASTKLSLRGEILSLATMRICFTSDQWLRRSLPLTEASQ